MVKERDLFRLGFKMNYPFYERGSITLYAYDDDDRLDVYYMIDKRPISDRASFPYEKSIRIRTVEQLEEIVRHEG
jgi:hypothetical protein